MKKNIKIAIADDHQIIYDGLRSLIESKSEFLTLAGGVKDGTELIELLKKETIDLAIVDISMEKMNGIEATKIIKRDFIKTKVLILSMHAEKSFIQAALRAGADAYLLKECAFEELIIAIKTVMSGRIFLSSSLNDQIIREYINWQSDPKKNNAHSILTPREYEILKLLADGLTTKEIAHKLDISPKTIESHRQQVMTKLNITSIAQLIRYALKEGISSL